MKLRFLLILVAACGLGVGVWWLYRHFQGHDGSELPTSESSESAGRSEDSVQLTSEKVTAAGIKVQPVGDVALQQSRVVPGRLVYDDTRHIEVKVPVAGILTRVCVKPSDHVVKGQTLAVINSPEVGEARADVVKRRAEVEISKQKFVWEQATQQGLEKLIADVKRGIEAKEVAANVQGVTLGNYREEILTAYSRLQLAEWQVASVKAMSDPGILAGRIVRERLSEKESADAALQTAVEQSSFESRQHYAEAELNAADASRRLKISEQHLATLLGYEDSGSWDESGSGLSAVEVHAPFDGTIESKIYSVSERVAPGASLFVLADTSKLWVSADIREREWEAVHFREGQPLSVAVPSIPDKELAAQVYFVGREVSPETNAIPLMATIDNADGMLRPGQYVQVRLPIGPKLTTLAVPSAAIVEHEGRPFVFVQTGPNSYRRANIRVGISDSGWTEVKSGLSDKEPVVVEGAFFLKSELLLEGEEE